MPLLIREDMTPVLEVETALLNLINGDKSMLAAPIIKDLRETLAALVKANLKKVASEE